MQHDIVREYAISQYTEEELRELQQKAVSAFGAHRPHHPDPAMLGLRSWCCQKGNDCALYVRNEVEHHIRGGLDLSEAKLPSCVGDWVRCYAPEDDLEDRLTFVLGTERWLALRKDALDTRDDWLAWQANNRWMWCFIQEFGTSQWIHSDAAGSNFAPILPTWRRLILDDQRPTELTAMQYEHMALGMCHLWYMYSSGVGLDDFLDTGIGKVFTKDDMEKLEARALVLLETTEAGRAHRADPVKMREQIAMDNLKATGDLAALEPMELKQYRDDLQAMMQRSDDLVHAQVLKHLHLLYINRLHLLGLAEWDWGLIDRIDMLEPLRSFNFDADTVIGGTHESVVPVSFIAALRGDISTANVGAELNVGVCRQLLAKEGVEKKMAEARLVACFAESYLPLALMQLGRGVEAAELMTETGLTWSGADAKVDAFAKLNSRCRERGNGEAGKGPIFECAEDLAWAIKLQYVLLTTWREVPPAEVIAALPSPEQLAAWMIVSYKPGFHGRLRHGIGHPLLLAAMVCEKLERPADALQYLEQALRVDPEDPATDRRPTTQAQGLAIKGRVLAAQGEASQAEAAFEQAIEISRRCGLRLYGMFAVRDLNAHVLDGGGRGEEGLKRLRVVLEQMKGEPAELAKLLGGGLDAAQVLRS